MVLSVNLHINLNILIIPFNSNFPHILKMICVCIRLEKIDKILLFQNHSYIFLKSSLLMFSNLECLKKFPLIFVLKIMVEGIKHNLYTLMSILCFHLIAMNS